ncbi:helix-turn-helix domain-containing protein [Patescibacteria group bacterium]|nr:helix-turn-helix domain-containing protein [Patescibacteria group bacterium]
MSSNLNIYTLEEVAQVFKVSLRTVYRWVESGQLKSSKLGRKTYRVFEKDLVDFMNKHRS